MVIVYMALSILGAMLTAMLVGLSQHSLLAAFLTAPIGGSLFAVMVALLLVARAQSRSIHALSHREDLVVPPGVVWG
jgi:hypothetical protein